MVLGHFIADYIVQSDWMARNKSKNNLTGWIAAISHCITYTIVVCSMMNNFDIIGYLDNDMNKVLFNK